MRKPNRADTRFYLNPYLDKANKRDEPPQRFLSLSSSYATARKSAGVNAAMPSSPAIYSSTDQDGDLLPDHDPQNMGRFSLSPTQREKPHIEILLDTPYLTLKGTGPDVEPTRLSGNVVLHLTEASDIKEVTLQFRGKARIPVPANESCVSRFSFPAACLSSNSGSSIIRHR